MSNTENKEYIEEFFEKIKKQVFKNYANKNYESVMKLCSTYVTLAYNTNQFYADTEIEEILKKVVKNIIKEEDIPKSKTDNVICFYDGFGLNSRGLVQIYLKALCQMGQVLYITGKSRSNYIPDVLTLLRKHNAYIEYIDDEVTYTERATQLNAVIKKYTPRDMFFYSKPNDVVGYMVFTCYEGVSKRYQINLTDHAFWLGTDVMDCCIEFRNYGATISNLYRMIPKEKLVVLPFYPEVNENISFQGYPNGFDEGDSFIFSGGSLYKTLGGDNKYYKMIEVLLTNHDDLKFWYAGNGNKVEITKLIRKFPSQVVLTEERTDFYEVIKRSCFYLSTYPICGGLMFQYVAKAGKVPLTLKHDNITDDFLLNQDALGIEYESLDELLVEADRLLSDKMYLEEKNHQMKSSIIDESKFYTELERLLKFGETKYEVIIKSFDLTQFKNEYLNRMTPREMERSLINQEQLYLFRYFPIRMIRGMIYKVYNKIKSLI